MALLRRLRAAPSRPAPTSPSCASAAARTRCAASTPRSSTGSGGCRCRRSRCSTATRWAAARSWRTPATSGSVRRRTRIGNPEPGLGILAAAGASWRLAELVGEPVAKEVLLAGRILDADEALRRAPADRGGRARRAARGRAPRSPTGSPGRHRSPSGSPRRSSTRPARRTRCIDDVAQAVLFETEDKQRRMTAFLDRKKDEAMSHAGDPGACPRPSASTAAAGWAPASRTRSCVAGPAVVVVENDEAAADGRPRPGRRAACAAPRSAASSSGALAERARPARRRPPTPAALAGAGLVVEAVPEDPTLKARVLRRGRGGRARRGARHQHQLAVDRRPRRRAARARAVRRPALLQPGAGQRPGRDRGRLEHRRRTSSTAAQGWVARPRQDRDHRHRLPGLRQQPARRRDRAGGDADARGGRRLGRRHRHRDDARLPAPGGPAADHRPRRARRTPGDRRAPRPRARRRASSRRRSCATRSPPASSAARPARASTRGERRAGISPSAAPR